MLLASASQVQGLWGCVTTSVECHAGNLTQMLHMLELTLQIELYPSPLVFDTLADLCLTYSYLLSHT